MGIPEEKEEGGENARLVRAVRRSGERIWCGGGWGEETETAMVLLLAVPETLLPQIGRAHV